MMNITKLVEQAHEMGFEYDERFDTYFSCIGTNCEDCLFKLRKMGGYDCIFRTDDEMLIEFREAFKLSLRKD